MRLKDKVIIITGSTTGIGEAMAERCVAEGAKVILHGTNRSLGEKVAARLGKAAVLHLDDLADPGSPERIVQTALAAFGRIDGAVNNAAIVPRGDLLTTDVKLFDSTMAINIRAPILLIKAAFNALRHTQGAVLNIGSVNALSGEPTLLAYSVSKGALQTLSRNLANAHAVDGVRINHLNVGWVSSEREHLRQVEQGQPDDWMSRLTPEQAPSGRLIRPEEIASAAVYWIGNESRPISGSVVELEQYSMIGCNRPKKFSDQVTEPQRDTRNSCVD